MLIVTASSTEATPDRGRAVPRSLAADPRRRPHETLRPMLLMRYTTINNNNYNNNNNDNMWYGKYMCLTEK